MWNISWHCVPFNNTQTVCVCVCVCVCVERGYRLAGGSVTLTLPLHSPPDGIAAFSFPLPCFSIGMWPWVLNSKYIYLFPLLHEIIFLYLALSVHVCSGTPVKEKFHLHCGKFRKVVGVVIPPQWRAYLFGCQQGRYCILGRWYSKEMLCGRP